MKLGHRSLALLLLPSLGLAFVVGPALAETKKVKKTRKNTDDAVSAVTEFEEGGFRKVNLDVNGDGTADVFNYYRTGEGDESRLLVRKEINLDFKGGADVTQMWDNGSLLREEIDADFDGRVDWIDFYDGGERIRAEWDTQFDGRADLIRYYEGGKLSRVEMDTDSDGKMNYWEYYQDGVMQRAGWDLNGDGKIDKWGDR